MEVCKHLVQYYETDKMGCVHHSNYIRWMEEARVFFLSEINLPYDKLEEMGIISPVVTVEFNYKYPAKFNDLVYIKLKLTQYNGIKMIFDYEMVSTNGTIYGTGHSKHCFIDETGKPISLKITYPSIHEEFLKRI